MRNCRLSSATHSNEAPQVDKENRAFAERPSGAASGSQPPIADSLVVEDARQLCAHNQCHCKVEAAQPEQVVVFDGAAHCPMVSGGVVWQSVGVCGLVRQPRCRLCALQNHFLPRVRSLCGVRQHAPLTRGHSTAQSNFVNAKKHRNKKKDRLSDVIKTKTTSSTGNQRSACCVAARLRAWRSLARSNRSLVYR